MKVGAPLSPPPSAQVLAVNVLLYAFLAMFALGVLPRKDLQRLVSVPRFLILTAFLRIVWFGSEYAGWGDTAGCKDPKAVVSFCGRLAGLALFSAFSTVLFFWWDVLRSDPKALLEGAAATTTSAAAGAGVGGGGGGGGAMLTERAQALEQLVIQQSTWRRICVPRTVDLLLKFWVFAVLGGLFVYKMFTCDDQLRQQVSDAEIVAIGFFMAVLAVGFAIVGYQLKSQLALRESVSSTQLQFRISVISICCVVCFSVRCVLFLLYPVFGVKLKGTARSIMYPWMFYTIPEIVPSLVVLVFLMKRRKISVALEDALLIAPTEHRLPEDSSLRVFRV